MSPDRYCPPRSVSAKLLRRWRAQVVAAPCTVAAPGGLASFTFDDAPSSAAVAGAAILEAAGARGTYYISAGLLGQNLVMGPMVTAAEVRDLAARGHEIGCHSFSHLDCARAPVAAVRADLARNAAASRAMGLRQPLRSFAYPSGETSLTLKRSLPAGVWTARGIRRGINVGPVDAHQLRAICLSGPRATDRARHAIALAHRRGGWVVFMGHDVADDPSPFGCTPAVLAAVVALVQAAGLPIKTMADAAQGLGLGAPGHAP